LADGFEALLGSEFVEVERRLSLEGREVDTLQVGDVLVAIAP